MPGDIAVVMGAGPIGMVTALAALAGGCSQVIMTDVVQPKLDLAASLGPITPVNVAEQDVCDVVMAMTDDWGADIVFECSGNERAAAQGVRCAAAGRNSGLCGHAVGADCCTMWWRRR